MWSRTILSHRFTEATWALNASFASVLLANSLGSGSFRVKRTSRAACHRQDTSRNCATEELTKFTAGA
jgi:hypothetical protein